MGNQEINIIDILAILVKRRKFIFFNVVIIAIISVILNIGKRSVMGLYPHLTTYVRDIILPML